MDPRPVSWGELLTVLTVAGSFLGTALYFGRWAGRIEAKLAAICQRLARAGL